MDLLHALERSAGRSPWKQLGPGEPNQNSPRPLGDQRIPNHEVILQLVVCFPRRTREMSEGLSSF